MTNREALLAPTDPDYQVVFTFSHRTILCIVWQCSIVNREGRSVEQPIWYLGLSPGATASVPHYINKH